VGCEMGVYVTKIRATVTAVLRLIADTNEEAEAKAERMLRNDVPHDIEVTEVNVEEEQ
jgi:hypothetical protein